MRRRACFSSHLVDFGRLIEWTSSLSEKDSRPLAESYLYLQGHHFDSHDLPTMAVGIYSSLAKLNSDL